jgi:alpha-amylase
MKNASLLISFAIVFCLIGYACSGTAEQWKSRTIYQVLTDRFARNDGSSVACNNLGWYCGGGYVGLRNHLDYIQGMGFDAIWISPIIDNRDGGYHGYWGRNIF